MKKVSIIGRANVGKSTLFNRIIGKKKALVSDRSHLTRDRNYEICIWNKKQFLLVDTGGLEKENGVFDKHWIAKNVSVAVKESSLIVLVVDGSAGYNPLDKDVLQWIREQSKDIIVAVNKVDSSAQEMIVTDFYKLGVATVCPVSGLHNRGISDLLDKITDRIEQPSELKKIKIDINVAIVGKPNVGKSSIINKILGESRVLVSEIPGTTRDAIDTYTSRYNKIYCFIDTAGIRRKKRFKNEFDVISVKASHTSIKRADVAVLVIDATTGLVEQDLRIARIISDYGRASIITVNKWDLIEDKESYVKKIKSDIRNIFPFLSYAPILFVSAITGEKIEKLFPIIETVYTEYEKKLAQGDVTDAIKEIYNFRAPAKTSYGKNVFIKRATQIKTKPPTFFIKLNRDAKLEKSYIKYIENSLRKRFGFKGTPIKIVVGSKQ